MTWAAEPAKPAPKIPPEQEEFFEKKIRPLLNEKCVSCHGPKEQEAELRLDSREFLMRGAGGAPVAVAGEPDRSRLIQVTRYDGDVQMPPDGKLPADELAALTTWVKMGMPWPANVAADQSTTPAAHEPRDSYEEKRRTHWAYQPVKKPELPKVSNEAWCRTPVDRFILAELDAHQLAPSPAADRRTLLRRVTFDLTGLPPTYEEMEAFAADKSPDAFAKVVERLLASPAYGERWARHWLDVARYSDTKGYVFTEERRYPYAYTYRDYVINAFNRDLPYDRFVQEQLAADLLPDPREPQALAALGFLTVGRRFSNNTADIIDDRIDVVSRGLLGMTVGCARCHDHKYDPIPTDDYYSMYGVFASCVEPKDLPQIGESEDGPAYQKFQTELATREKDARDYLEKARVGLEQEVRARVGDYLAQVLIERLKSRKDKNAEDDFMFSFRQGEPRAPIVRRWRDFLAKHGKPFDSAFALWHECSKLTEAGQDFDREVDKIVERLKQNETEAKAKHNRILLTAFLAAPPRSMNDLIAIYQQALTDVDKQWTELQAKPVEGQDAKRPEKLDDPAAEQLRQVFYGDKSPVRVSEGEIRGLLDRKTRDTYTQLERKIENLKATSPAAPPRAMVLNDAPQPNNPVVFIRGNPGRRGKQVPRQFYEAASPSGRQPFTRGSGRLELAQAITSRDNPLTARVMANRVWLHHFGTGIVPGPSDFGTRSDPPSHPALLDWLASQFMEQGWSVKQLHRLMVLSATYQQASHVEPGRAKIDPDNHWYWRMNRQRLEFEPLRDSLLSVAGVLETRVGGRPVELFKSPYSARRTVYGLVDRQDMPNALQIFDFANPDVSNDQRPRTTVPQQALWMMNSPLVIDQASKLAARALKGKPDDVKTRVTALFRLALARDPQPEELELARRYIENPKSKSDTTATWQYGYAGIDEEAKKVVGFTTISHWTGKEWNGGPKFPDPKLGHLKIGPTGGHPGSSRDVSAVIRWTAPEAGQVKFLGRLKHPSDQGDGVELIVVSSRQGILNRWTAQNKTVGATIDKIDVQPGEVIDLLVQCRESGSFDSYEFLPRFESLGTDRRIWDAAKDFHGPLPRPLSPWETLAQILLDTNEFMFID
ncbi:MAG: PSD1 domain-containing protein [Planctomycetes bacterium]|nr:PSD1 domain-containing protein [Planctomycetota bacterium]